VDIIGLKTEWDIIGLKTKWDVTCENYVKVGNAIKKPKHS
jgi:hypothetical protein